MRVLASFVIALAAASVAAAAHKRSAAENVPLYDVHVNMNPRISEHRGDTSVATRHLVLTSAWGARYNCSVPIIESTIEPEEETESADAHETEEQRAEALEDVSWESVATPLQGQCLQYKENPKDWFTLELCIGKHVRQFHNNEKGELAEEYMLGKSSTKEPELIIKESSQDSLFFRDAYDDGEMCANIGKARSVNVTYRCSIGHEGKSAQVASVASFKETKTCVYEVEVQGPLFCRNGSRPSEDDQDLRRRVISCVPKYERHLSEVTGVYVVQDPSGTSRTATFALKGGKQREFIVSPLQQDAALFQPVYDISFFGEPRSAPKRSVATVEDSMLAMAFAPGLVVYTINFATGHLDGTYYVSEKGNLERWARTPDVSQEPVAKSTPDGKEADEKPDESLQSTADPLLFDKPMSLVGSYDVSGVSDAVAQLETYKTIADVSEATVEDECKHWPDGVSRTVYKIKWEFGDVGIALHVGNKLLVGYGKKVEHIPFGIAVTKAPHFRAVSEIAGGFEVLRASLLDSGSVVVACETWKRERDLTSAAAGIEDSSSTSDDDDDDDDDDFVQSAQPRAHDEKQGELNDLATATSTQDDSVHASTAAPEARDSSPEGAAAGEPPSAGRVANAPVAGGNSEIIPAEREQIEDKDAHQSASASAGGSQSGAAASDVQGQTAAQASTEAHAAAGGVQAEQADSKDEL